MKKYEFYFTTHLINHFNAKKIKNPRYSLRNYANFLDIPAPYLSRLFRGLIPPTPRLIKKLSIKLNLSESELIYFINDIERNRLKIENQYIKNIELKEIYKDNSKLPLEVISSFNASAILEILNFDSQELSEDFLARILKIDQKEVRKILDIFLEHQIIYLEDGKYRRNIPQYMKFNSDHGQYLKEFIKKRQLETLKYIEKSITEESFKPSGIYSALVAIDSRISQQVIDKIKEQRNELILFIEKQSKKYDQLIDLSIAFTSITSK